VGIFFLGIMRSRIARFFWKRSIRYFLLPLLAVVGIFSAYPLELPSVPYSTVLLDRTGREVGEIVYDRRIRHRPTDSRTVPEFFRTAIVAIEDRHYSGHLGISLRGLGRAALRAIEDGGFSQGASTIPAQYVRNALWPTATRTLWRKGAEFALAVNLSIRHSKSDVLSGYLDSLSFGRLAYGPESGARVWFGRPLSALSRAELLALVTIAKNPGRYDPIRSYERYHARYTALADRLAELGEISSEERDGLVSAQIVFLAVPPADRLPYVRDFVAEREGGSAPSLTLPIDAGLTERVAAIAEHVRTSLSGRGVSDYAVLVVDRETMELRVMIGGANYDDPAAGQVNSALALRQPGSTLKPFIYLLADELLGKKPEDSILDLPVAYETAEGYAYEPKNYSLGYAGSVSQAQALAESLNIPAVKLANEIGIERVYDFLKSAGVESLDRPASHYGLALALGAAEVPLWQLVRAYSVFARDGDSCDIRVLPQDQLSCRPIAQPAAVRDIVDTLSNPSYKIGQFPLYGDLDFSDRFAMVKTGTSRNYRDTWAVGFTDRYMIGVWSGNKSGAETDRIGSVTGAGAIFARIVRELEPASPVNTSAPALASKKEYFEITHPLEGARFSPDPDSPPEAQSIALRYATDMKYDRVEYLYDGRALAEPQVGVEPGEHTVIVRLRRGDSVVAERRVRYSVRSNEQ
jgi:penicillin-binding protein 1C